MKYAIAASFAALGIALAGTAGASPEDLTNADVRSTTTPSPKFVPYKVIVPVADTGGQGPFDRTGGMIFDDGLSDSSREILKAVTAP